MKKEPKFKITNMVFNGKFPFKRNLKFDEIDNILENGSFFWSIINQESSPMLIARLDLEGFNKMNKQRVATITLWHSGAFNMAGVNKRKEAKECYNQIFNEVKRLAPKVFKGK